MKRLVYAVLRAPTRPPRTLHGPDGRPVELVSKRGLCAAVSPADDAPISVTVQRLLDYERVVEALLRRGDLVPMRFGSVLDSDDAVAGFLAERGAKLRAQLRAVHGCVEMGVRLDRSPEPSESSRPQSCHKTHAYLTQGRSASRTSAESSSGPGQTYLRSRARQLPDSDPADSRQLIDPCCEAVRGLYTEVRAESPASLGTEDQDARANSLSVSFLVPRPRVAAFRRALLSEVDALGGGTVSGPWPPYSFVTG
ncbi:MAG: GvpL/GvpF family gas vesicle protein [Myxococcales bacterium]